MIKILFCPIRLNTKQLEGLPVGVVFDQTVEAERAAARINIVDERERTEAAREIVLGWFNESRPLRDFHETIAIYGSLAPWLRHWLFTHSNTEGEVKIWVFEPGALTGGPIPWGQTGLYSIRRQDILEPAPALPAEPDPDEIVEFIKITPLGGDAYILPRAGIGAGMIAELEDLRPGADPIEYEFEALSMSRREADALPEL